MAHTLEQGQITSSGFEILQVLALEEFKAQGIWARHQKTGAEVFHVLNDDVENLFSFAFATPPTDSTGASHILEHVVLCGSQSYPLKDAFLVLARGSLQTFLNAWTFPDKTVYPASSVNPKDYFNLMSVYGDAVFRPLLSEWTFRQEGHRLFFGPGEQKLQRTGVVYNEMKGSYSSLDAYAGLWSMKAVLPGTPYDFESGGDPDRIPDLSWEELKAFHRRWYSPANCRIFLAGNIPTETQLAFLDQEFFSSLEGGQRSPGIPKAELWDAPRSFTIPCPRGSEQKPTFLLSWLCGDVCDTEETLSLALLAEILLGHDGSPLTRALISSGLGEDLSPVSGLEGELRQSAFCIGLRGLDDPQEGLQKAQDLILGELEKLSEEGIPKEEIEAALLGMEFSHREIRRSGGPFSLVWMRRSLRAWLHGGRPWDSLLFAPSISSIKAGLAADDRYFEKRIRRYLLDNPHRARVLIEPQEGFLEEREAQRLRALADLEGSLSPAERQNIEEANLELERRQEEDDSPEALARIPHLSRGDLSSDIEHITRDYAYAEGAPVLVHPLFTNGISYVDIAIPLDILAPEEYPWLPFFVRSLVSMGLPGMDYGQVSSLMARTAGGFHGMLHTGSMVRGAARAAALPSGVHDITGRDWAIFRLKALDEKIGPSLDLALRLITEADFSDLRRLRDLVLETKNDLDSSLAPSGHSYAAGFSGRLFSRSRGIEELWSGLDQILFIHRLSSLGDEEISARLRSLQAALLHGGVLINYRGSAFQEAHKEIGSRFGFFGPPRPRNPASQNMDLIHTQSALGPAAETQGTRPVIFSSPSLQVGFASFSLRAQPYGSDLQAAELVLSHQLSTGALWERIRMKGGAYGAFAQPDHLEGPFLFSTYRDPRPLESLEVFSSIIKEAAQQSVRPSRESQDELDKAVIGTYSRETRPRTPAEKGLADFLRFLYGIEDRHRSQRLKGILAVGQDQMARVLQGLAQDQGSSYPALIMGRRDAEGAASRLGVPVIELPV
ncbi:MAG: insulinase family protein [Treponema sp.]|nr:insulinase family protein [Treponema sp.]